MRTPSDAAWREATGTIGCDLASIKATFEVEAANKFFNADGSIPRRFEPHHFPKGQWGRIGFDPGKLRPWKASMKISTAKRRQMFATAENIDHEAAYEAASWGAPQIMGFNHGPAGFASATQMVDAMQESADNQLRAFVSFIMSQDLDGFLRSHDFFSFAARYNGTGQAQRYAGLIRSAYRRHSGGQGVAPILRLGSRGDAVDKLQQGLHDLGYLEDVDGAFGAATKAAVETFQRDHGLKMDGVVGKRTWEKIVEVTSEKADIDTVEQPEDDEPEALDINLGEVVKKGGPLLTGGAASGIFATLGENAQLLLVAGLVVIAIGVAAAFVIPRLRHKAT